MTAVSELLRRLISLLQLRGRWCLQILLHVWRRLARALGVRSESSNEQGCSPKNPEMLSKSADSVSASRIPGPYELDSSSNEYILLAESSQGSSSTRGLELDTRERPRRQSTSQVFSPDGTTIVSSPLSIRPRGSLPLPSQCPDGPDVQRLNATIPTFSRRYHGRPPPKVESCLIPAGPLAVNRGRKRSLHDDWKEYIHPEGQSYFVNACNSINIVTEGYVYDARIRQVISDYAESVLARHVSECWHSDPSSVELLIDIDGEGELCSYYFLDHENTLIFWLDETNTDDVGLDDVSGIDHLRTQLHGQYWLHQEYFPHRDLPGKHERDLMATLTHSCIDVITANTSTSSFDRSQLETILSIMKSLKNTVGSNGQRNCIVARLWNEIYTARFINFYGERDARLYRSHIVVKQEPSSIFMKIVFLLLFDAPSTHLTTLSEFYVDEILYTDGWRKFMEVLLNDWNDMILWATVLLAANMSFLAIFNSTQQVQEENRAVTCSLVSTLCSTISIVIGLLHVRKHRPRSRTHAADGSRYLTEATHPKLGLRPLAIIYSLPYAFLMWAMVTFIAAILLFVFQSGVSPTSQVFISVIAACLGITLAWVVMYFWKDELQLMDDFRGLCATLNSLSPVALIRLVSNVAPPSHNPEAANTPIVQHWLHKTAEASNEKAKEGV